MNDFTKEELEYLIQCVINDIDMIDNCGDDYDELNAAGLVENKLQSMIDNYCRHVNSNIYFTCEDCEMIL